MYAREDSEDEAETRGVGVSDDARLGGGTDERPNGRRTRDVSHENAKLWARSHAKQIVLTDEKGGTGTVTIPDVFQSNGVIHVVDSVLLPN